MKKTRIDLSPLRTATPFVIIAGIVGGFGLLFYELFQSDSAQLDAAAATQTVEETVTHTLVNAHTVSRQEGTIQTIFNFGSRHVFVAGYVNRDEIAGAFSFRAFDNDEMIEEVRRIGCETARRASGILDDYNFGSLVRSESESISTKKAEARVFLQHHCAAAP